MPWSTTLQGGERVDVVVVAYDSAATIDACLVAALAQDGVASVVVVDNGSRDDTRARVARRARSEPRLALIERPENPGFAASCNAGAAVGHASWLLFLNPDLELPADALSRLLALGRSVPRLGALGADLRDPRGHRDAAARRRDLRLARLLRAAGGRDALNVPPDDAQPLQPVEACSGALMLVPRAAFDAVGGWDAGYRLHVEDLDLCRRLRGSGYAVVVANAVPVLHHRGVSSRSRPFFVEWHKHRGLWRYWWRFEATGLAVVLAPIVIAALAARLFLVAWPLAAWRRLRG